MKKIAILTALMLYSLTLMAQRLTTSGTDFWLIAPPNWLNNDVDTYTFAVGGKRSCSVTISNPNTTWSYTMNTTANQVTSYTLPTSLNNHVWQAGSCTTLNTGVHITATDTVQVYFYSHSGTASSAGANTVLPTEALGVDYIIQNYPVNYPNQDAAAYFSILATEDSTVVDIYLEGNTSSGILAGNSMTITLNAGQVYQVLSPEHLGDFSGTTIHSHDCKLIAVIAGATAVPIPANGVSGDHIYQQCHPVSSWANEWILTPSSHHNIDYVRVTAAADNCQIFLNGSTSPTTTINTAQTYEFSITSATQVTTTQPASIFQYLDSRHTSSQGGDYGDVSSFTPNPLNMTSRHATFPAFQVDSRSPSVSQYYVNIVVPTTETSLMRYNGSAISSSFTSVSGTNYSYVRIPINQTGQHLLTTTGCGFIAHSYGVGENWEAYAFSLGGEDSNSTPLAANLDTVDTVDITYCGNIFHFLHFTFNTSVDTLIPTGCSLIRLRLTLLSPTIINSDTTLCATTFNWRGHTISHPGLFSDTVYNPDGCYTVYRLQVYFTARTTLPPVDTSLCADSFTWREHTYTHSGTYYDTIQTPEGCDSVYSLRLTLKPSYHFTVDTIICQSALLWGDTALTASGTHHLHYTTHAGCDSSYIIHLTLLPSYDTTYDTTACIGTIEIDGTQIAVPGYHTFHYSASDGCDSIVHVNILAYPHYDTTYFVSITDTESYEWINGHYYFSSTDTVIILTDHNGCDSIMRLLLTVRPIPRSPDIWVPNIFIPTAAENNRFKVFSKHVDKMTVTIFHRWGEKVCTFDGLTEDWDGTHNGILCPEGAYIYLIKYHATEIAEGANNHPIVGTVLLIR